MMYPYMILADETEIVHSHIIDNNGVQCVEVHFERPTEDGFDVARALLPTSNWIIEVQVLTTYHCVISRSDT